MGDVTGSLCSTLPLDTRVTFPCSGFPAPPRGLHPSVKLNRRPPTPHLNEAGPSSRLRAQDNKRLSSGLPQASTLPPPSPLLAITRLLTSAPADPLPRTYVLTSFSWVIPMPLSDLRCDVPSLQSPPPPPQPSTEAPPPLWESLFPAWSVFPLAHSREGDQVLPAGASSARGKVVKRTSKEGALGPAQPAPQARALIVGP